MISVKNLCKNFGGRHAVNDVSFEVKKGDVLGFLGPNGAGKTTTMRMITGYLTPTSGSVSVNGFDVQENPTEARKCIGFLPESAPSYADMTVTAFLKFIAEMRGFSGSEREQRVEAVVEKCLLNQVRHRTIETLSKGYRQRVCLAQAIIHDPPILILDEPTDGLDPNQKHVVRQMIAGMAKDKVVIFSTHILEEVGAICSRAIIISGGKVVADSTPAELMKKGSLEEVFRRLTTTADLAAA